MPDHPPLDDRPLRLAVVTESISHFEVPLYRLCAQEPALRLMVFYVDEAHTGQHFDREYGQAIAWGVDLLAGYPSLRVEDRKQLRQKVLAWQADVVLLYGYGWSGARSLILDNWLSRQAQVHRGTLNYYFDPRQGWLARLARPVRNILLRLFDSHHYGGDYSRQVLQQAGVPEEACFFVPYSVDTPYFLTAADDPDQAQAGTEIRNRLGWQQDDHVLLFIAQHNWFKGPDIALQVFTRWAEHDSRARLLIVGSGKMTAQLEEIAAARLAAGSYHFAGFVPSASTIAYYLAADLVLCTSRYETWARMVNEAMLCQRPCVVGRIVPAAGGLVQSEVNGYVVDTGNQEQFVAALERFFALPIAVRQRMGQDAREKARQFSYEPNMPAVLAAARFAYQKANGRAFPEAR